MAKKRAKGALSAEFIAEAQEIVDGLNRELIASEEDLRSGEIPPERINTMFRHAHSLKGLAGMFGADEVTQLAHALESVLDAVRLGKVEVNAAALDVLFGCVEHFSLLIGAASAGEEADPALLQNLIGRLETVSAPAPAASEADSLSDLDLGEEVLGVLTEYEEHRLRENLRRGRGLFLLRTSFELSSFDMGLAELEASLKGHGEIVTKLPSASAAEPGSISFDLIVGSESSSDALARAIADERVEISAIHRRRRAGAPTVAPTVTATSPASAASTPARGLDRPRAVEAAVAASVADLGADVDVTAVPDESSSVKSVSQTVRVDIRRLDRLMNMVGELALTKMAFQSLSDALRRHDGAAKLAAELHEVTRDFERRLSDLQSGIMEVRMVPIANLFERMVRIARKVARELGKQARVEVSGEGTELDKLIVEDLAEPLMHLIRNAIDHGIETPTERQAAGKDPEGVVRLGAQAIGNHVVVQITDDGRGIDRNKVAERAVAMGLISADRLAEMSPREVLNLIFLPGLSTRAEVSEFSGRGVGMDVVKTNIAAISGVIDLESTPQGTRVTITLPITLAIIPALVVSVSASTYAIPLNNVLETIPLNGDNVRTIEKRQVISLRGSTVPLLDLRDLFNLGGTKRPPTQFGVIAGAGDNVMALVVDDLIGQQDIVIKSLGRRLSKVRGIAGATELGNQRTILVLDTVDLLSELAVDSGVRV